MSTNKCFDDSDRDLLIERMDKARRLSQRHRYREALAEFLWCFDNGARLVPSFRAPRLSFLLNDIVRLAAEFPPASTALRERRDRVESKVLAGDVETWRLQELVALNRALQCGAHNVELFERLGELRAKEGDWQSAMVRLIIDDICQHKRYTAIVKSDMDIVEEAWRVFRAAEALRTCAAPEENGEAALRNSVLSLAEYQDSLTLKTMSCFYEVLVALGHTSDAARLLDSVATMLRCSAYVYCRFSECAIRAGRADVARDVIRVGVNNCNNAAFIKAHAHRLGIDISSED